MPSNGNCFICGKTASKIATKNHILKEHNAGDEQCYLIKAEGAYDRNYWLFFTVSLDASLSSVDKFLRDIWCECCGHLSAFRRNGGEFGKARKLSALNIGDMLLYEYDFGTTTEIVLTVVSEIVRPKQKEKVQLLARNIPAQNNCKCGTPATHIDATDGSIYCDECAQNVEDDDVLMLITNSPRSGECGYDGGLDIWKFDPNGLFPQPQKRKAKR